MASKSETNLIAKISRQTDKYRTRDNERAIYRQKMNMAIGSPAGTPDLLYEGSAGDMWIEYKCIPDWKSKRKIPINMLSANQLNWLTRRISNGRPCAVIIGDDSGNCLILDGQEILKPPDIDNMCLITPVQVASWIASKTNRINLP